MLKEFKEFAMRGNVLDMAVGVIIGGAFGKIVTSLVNDVIMPPIGLLIGKVNFSNLFVNLSSQQFNSLAEAKVAGIPTINYGIFLNTLIDFIIQALVIFMVIQLIQKIRHRTEQAPAPLAPTTRNCPFCYSVISLKANRCPNCTSDLKSAANSAMA